MNMRHVTAATTFSAPPHLFPFSSNAPRQSRRRFDGAEAVDGRGIFTSFATHPRNASEWVSRCRAQLSLRAAASHADPTPCEASR
eukprot:2249228-Pyramimonas_sp.AAC.1